MNELLHKLRLWFERNIVTVGFDQGHGPVIRVHWRWYYWSIGIDVDSFPKYDDEDEYGPPSKHSILEAMFIETRMEIKDLIGSFKRMVNGWPKKYFFRDLWGTVRPHVRTMGWYSRWQRRMRSKL